MNIEEASTKLDEAMKAVANRAFKASQLCDDWPEILKLAVLDSELGEVPSWPAAKRDFGMAIHVDACPWYLSEPQHIVNLVQGIKCGDGWLCDKAREIEKLGKEKR